jgi:7,8-dihydropterin-6-yl-methyl-4-(beta-D-ribofuranosyl)aminobenzene 5'-phosphate synthase
MSYRISPAWWPLLGLSSPVLIPMLLVKNRRFKQNIRRSQEVNKERMDRAESLEMPQLKHFEITVLVEQKVEPGFLGAPGVSYLIKTDQGSLLFDLGYGPEMPALAHNAIKLGFKMDQVDALAISHLHPDHMGGFKAVRKKQVIVPREIGGSEGFPCFLPAEANAEGFKAEVVDGPRMLAAGVASTGPLSRSLFLMGWTEEQAIVARLKDKGLVVFTGCGHPTIETIIQMVKRLSDEPIYAVGGGLHFPITDSPLRKPGLKVQMIWGTGNPPWKRISNEDLTRTIDHLNAVSPKHVFLSAHDTCDYAIDRFKNELRSEVEVLKAGATYVL